MQPIVLLLTLLAARVVCDFSDLAVSVVPAVAVGGQSKTQWPELVGKPAQEAVDTIKAQAPGFTVQTIGHDMMATTDWRCDRSAATTHLMPGQAKQ